MDNQQPHNPLTPPPSESSVHVGSDIPGGGNPIWQAFKSSKLLKFGLPALLVALLPVVVLLVREQQNVQSRASAATVLSISPASTESAPVTVNAGEYVTLAVDVDPGTNILSSVRLHISYDPNVLQVENPSDFVVNTSAFPVTLGDPSISSGQITATLLIGPDPAKAIRKKVQVGTIRFKAVKGGDTTLVSFGSNTAASSIGADDTFSENVLSSANGAYVAVTATRSTLPVVTVKPTIRTGTPSAILSVTKAPVCTGKTADINKDGRVDNADQTIGTNCLNKNTTDNPSCVASDINNDGVVNIVDLNCVLRGGQ